MRFITLLSLSLVLCLTEATFVPRNVIADGLALHTATNEERQHVVLPVVVEPSSTTKPPLSSQAVAWNFLRGGAIIGAFETRVLSAVGMMGALVAIIQCNGIIPFIVVCQIAMFREATCVVGIVDRNKWWWFLTYFCAFPAKLIHTMPTISTSLLNFVALGMAMDGIAALVLQQNQQGVDSFGKALGDLAGSNVAAILIIGFSSCWILTIQEYGLSCVGYPALLVIINDTMAYFCGMLFGKHALLPKISPKKTWEGFIGAAIFTIALSLPLWNVFFDTPCKSQHVLFLAAYVSLVAPFGGFLASIVKRTHGKKDFGTLIPGHGGVVDRLDCQLLVAPFVYLGLKHFGGV